MGWKPTWESRIPLWPMRGKITGYKRKNRSPILGFEDILLSGIAVEYVSVPKNRICSEGSVFVNREGYTVFDRSGKKVKDSKSSGSEAGTALGGGGDMTDGHVANFFNVIRGTETKLNSPIEEGAVTQMLTHYANISSRINKSFKVNTETGHILDRAGMKLWDREYHKGWEPPKI